MMIKKKLRLFHLNRWLAFLMLRMSGARKRRGHCNHGHLSPLLLALACGIVSWLVCCGQFACAMWHYLRGPAGGRFWPIRARRVVICLQIAKELRLVVTSRGPG